MSLFPPARSLSAATVGPPAHSSTKSASGAQQLRQQKLALHLSAQEGLLDQFPGRPPWVLWTSSAGRPIPNQLSFTVGRNITAYRQHPAPLPQSSSQQRQYSPIIELKNSLTFLELEGPRFEFRNMPVQSELRTSKVYMYMYIKNTPFLFQITLGAICRSLF
jgi:hypothetical protein